MKNTFIKLVLLNLIISLILIIIFYLWLFIDGYGANNKYLSQEKRIFIMFVIFNFLLSIYMLNRLKQLNALSVIVTVILICFINLFVAKILGYF